jgi:hypothetical protein
MFNRRLTFLIRRAVRRIVVRILIAADGWESMPGWNMWKIRSASRVRVLTFRSLVVAVRNEGTVSRA